MRKILFAISLLAIGCSIQAQILCHVDNNTCMYVSEGTLVYSGGGLQTKGSGLLDVHGNIMVVGSSKDAFKTVDLNGADKTDGGNILLRLNNPASYDTSTYGQLFIDGLNQDNITGVVTKEYRASNHGNRNYFQQIALPFYGKAFNSLSKELGKNFNTIRYDNPILKWDNTKAVAITTLNLAPNSTTWDPTGYYMLKVKNNDWNPSDPISGDVFTIHGRPFASDPTARTLQNAGMSNIGNSDKVFGKGGKELNQYKETYNSYLDDTFEFTTNPWAGTFGQNFYQFGNPFLTNLDLAHIGYTENKTGSDGNVVKNIWGVEYNPGTIVTLPNGATYATDSKVVTFLPKNDGAAPSAGDVDLLVIKPMQSFKIKLRDNTTQILNFNTLRRFKSTSRKSDTDYHVDAAKVITKNAKNARNTLKQFGIIGLDTNGNEISRSYFVVSPTLTTGYQASVAKTIQVSAGDRLIGTFEESPNGGYDSDHTNYWLYINEANEVDFQGKNVKLVNYKPDFIKSYKFEIREDTKLIPEGTHKLSSGLGFYYRAENGNLIEAKQGAVIAVTNEEANLYYGKPEDFNIDTNKPSAGISRTIVVYNPTVRNYIVRFDPKWKNADIQVYDTSGKLVILEKNVDASRDFVIELDDSVKKSYIVKIVSDTGETVNNKILR